MEDRYYRDYKNSQYEDHNGGKFLFSEEVRARYIEQEEPTYKGNLLIEALPPINTYEHVCDMVERLPIFAESEREKKVTYRLHAVYRLLDYLLPMPKYYELEAKISIAIRRGYIGKSIMTPAHIKNLKLTSELLKSEVKIKKFKEQLVVNAYNAADAPAFALIGISGPGKSTACNNILPLYPQGIIHTGVGDEKYLFRQLSWIKIDCSYNGSLKGICQKFFYQVDKVLKTHYFDDHGSDRNSVDYMIIAMAHVAQVHGLGLLAIDEIQQLAKSKNGSVEALNFFVCMMNEIRLPILYIGTYKAIDNLFAKEYRQGRRADGIGCIEWNNLPQDEDWDYFIEDMWKYQWIKTYTPITQELKDTMYKKSMGIIDRAKKIFMAVQFSAIADGSDTITVKRINETADKYFLLTKKAIEALSGDDPEKLKEFDDLKTSEIKQLFEHSVDDAKFREKALQMIKDRSLSEVKKKKEIVNDIVMAVLQFGYGYDQVLNITIEIVNEFGREKDIDLLKKKVINRLLEEDGTFNKKNQNRGKTNNKRGKKPIDIKEFGEKNIVDVLDGVSSIDDSNFTENP